MAFTDPQTLTVNAVAKNCARVITDGQSSTYKTADGTFEFKISHQNRKGGRVGHMVRFDQIVIAADPLTAENKSQKAGVYLVIDEPAFGFDDTTLDYLVDAVVAWLTAGNIAKVLGGES